MRGANEAVGEGNTAVSAGGAGTAPALLFLSESNVYFCHFTCHVLQHTFLIAHLQPCFPVGHWHLMGPESQGTDFFVASPLSRSSQRNDTWIPREHPVVVFARSGI